MQTVCVFSGSSPGARPGYATAARRVGQELAARRIRLVYGGASVGLMGVVADTVLGLGGTVIGVIPELLVGKEIAHQGLSELRITATMHERKAMMADLSDGFLALPGGYGTLEEFAEVLTWSQLGLQRKPCGLLDVEAFYTPLLSFFDHAVTERFVPVAHRELVLSDADPRACSTPWRPGPRRPWTSGWTGESQEPEVRVDHRTRGGFRKRIRPETPKVLLINVAWGRSVLVEADQPTRWVRMACCSSWVRPALVSHWIGPPSR